jgi:hypothetical protein
MSLATSPAANPRQLPSWWFDWPWWVWITLTCCLLSAHLVALGVTFSWWALVGCILLLHLLWYWDAHSRFIAWILGFAAGFYVLVLIETYLGATGLYYGPIGSADRPPVLGDSELVWAFRAIYRFGSDAKSQLGLAIGLLIYAVLGFMPRQRPKLSRYADIAGGVLSFSYVLVTFTFTHPFDAKHVGIANAMFEASAALRSLGSYEEAGKEVAKNTKLLVQLSSDLEDAPAEEKRKELSDRIRKYSDLIVMLDEQRRRKKEILRQSPGTYSDSGDLPREARQYPPRPGPDFSPKDAEPQALNVSAEDILQAASRSQHAREVAEKAKEDEERGNGCFLRIYFFVGMVVSDEIGKTNRIDLVDVARNNVTQIIVLHNTAQAIAELDRRIDELNNEIRRQEQQNAELEQQMRNYTAALKIDLQRQIECAGELRAVSDWLRGEGQSVLQVIGSPSEGARVRLDGIQPRLPANVAPNGANVTLIRNEVTQDLTNNNRWPPSFTEQQMRQQLTLVSERGAGLVASFANAMCRAGRNADDIKAALRTVADQIRVPAPK